MDYQTDYIQLSDGCEDKKIKMRQQMTSDLAFLLSPYKNKDIGLRLVCEKTGISEKTLKRVLKGESNPHGETFHRFYEHFFKLNQIELPLTEIHKEIKEEYESTRTVKNQQLVESLEKMLKDNKVFRDIFLFTRTGSISKLWVQEQYGMYGIDIVSYMLKNDLLIETEKNVYREGPLVITKGSETLKTIIQDLVTDHFNVEALQEFDQNSAFYILEGVNEQVFSKVLMMTEEFKVALAKLIFDPESKGDKRLFVTTVVDALVDNDKKGNLN